MYPMTTETALDTNKRFCRRLHANLKTGEMFYDPPLDVSDASELLAALDQIACEGPVSTRYVGSPCPPRLSELGCYDGQSDTLYEGVGLPRSPHAESEVQTPTRDHQ